MYYVYQDLQLLMEKSNTDSFAEILHWRIELGGSFLLLAIVADVIALK